jgi:uncharacterized protein YukE
MPPETDPSEFENKPVLTDPQNWASRSHAELYAAVHNNNDPGAAGQISSDWNKYGSELTEASRTINAVITASESKWTGAAAEAARDAMKKLGDWVDETARTAVDVGNKVADQGRVMENARAQMPGPVEFDWNKAAAALTQPGTPAFVLAAADIAMANAASRAAHDQAINVMTTMENNSRQIDTSTPTFKPPFNPTTGQVEEPPVALQRLSGAPTLNGADGLMSTHAAGGAGVAAPPSPTGAAASGSPQTSGANAPAAAAYTPSAPGYTPPSNTGGGGGGGGGGGYTPQNPNYNPGNTSTAAATYTPSAPGYTPPPNPVTTHTSGGGNNNNNNTPQFPAGGPMRPNTNVPNPNYTPQNPNSPKGFTPTAPGYTGPGGPGGGAGGGGGGGAGSGMKPGAMPNFGAAGGGAGGFGGGPGGAGGAGGAMQAGGAAGVQGRAGAMPMGMTGPGGAAAAGAGMGAGAPMGGAPGAGGKGDEDKEHRSASYIMGGDLFEVPGENLPPSVIGGAKVKKPKGPDAS